jgi:hypothetical protein
MKKNVGNIDRVIRLILAVVAAVFAYKFGFVDWKSYALAGFSILMLITAISKSCPLFYLLNMNSIKIDL